MKKIVLVGHRGVGKSLLLKSINDFENCQIFDLDDEVEKKYQMSIPEIFKKWGEVQFRLWEVEVFNDLAQTNSTKNLIIAVGGGFTGEIPKAIEVVWLKRSEDPRRSIYLDRPLLDKGTLTLSEERFLEREARFAARADKVLWLSEGFYKSEERKNHNHEVSFILGNYKTNQEKNIFVTLMSNLEKKSFFSMVERMNLTVELRTDLFSPQQINKIQSDNKGISFLLSHRSLKEEALTLTNEHFIDWAGELGETQNNCDVYSWHGTTQPNHKSSTHVKWSPMVENFAELIEGHNWWLDDKANRSFLPRSADGSWKWYRTLMLTKQKINFIRFDEGSCLDQPTYLDWCHFQNSNYFAGVLGYPVDLSHSPSFHREFFKKRGANFFAIKISKPDFNIKNMDFLFTLGLRWAAVTSPLKEKLAELYGDDKTKAQNTLVWNKLAWQTTNTDVLGFKSLLSQADINSKATVVWGGGGVLASLKAVIPEAQYYSASLAKPREGSHEISSLEYLVWSAVEPDIEKIPTDWSPKLIIDVNYHKNSGARALALKKGCKYLSGELMFVEQAKAQQKYWESFDGCQ